MNELITINTNENQEPVISLRELHHKLEITERYSNWTDRMFKYGFEENLDYVGCKVFNAQARQEIQDHAIKLDMAKEICMLQRNEKGKIFRQYFIQVEKDFNSPEKIMARALLLADKKIHSLELQVKEQAPKVLFANAVETSHTNILVGDLAKILKQNGIDIGQNRLFKWLRDKNYLISRKGNSYNTPTQKAMELGLFKVKERVINEPNGSTTIKKTSMVTGKGQVYFVNKFLYTKF
jgi:phage antirepressor protein